MNKLINKIRENTIFRFFFVGGVITVIDFSVYFIFSLWVKISFAKAISMLIASVISYSANKVFTFQDKHKTDVGYLLRFYIVFAINFFANVSANYFFFEITKNKIVAFAFATLVGMSVNYLGQRFFVFKKQPLEK